MRRGIASSHQNAKSLPGSSARWCFSASYEQFIGTLKLAPDQGKRITLKKPTAVRRLITVVIGAIVAAGGSMWVSP
jgi:hypothetical protein